MNRSPLLLAALASLVTLSGCAEYAYAGNRSVDYDRYPTQTYGNGDYARTAAYRRVERDARAYANYLDRVLDLRGNEERRIRQLLEERTYDLLRRTPVRRHDRVYPFPRSSGRAVGFWRAVDRDIERILDYRYHEPYGYLNRYGESRYRDYYRYRTYDTRQRIWIDTRRDDRYRDNRYRSNDDGERRPRQDNRQDRRDDRQDNRQDRRDDRRDDRQDNRQDRRDDRRDDRQDRREDRRDDRTDRPQRDRDLNEWYRQQQRNQ